MFCRPDRRQGWSGFVLVVAVAASSGCATMFSGTTQPFTVRTEPPGAQVIVNGNYVGVTPLNIEVHRDKNLNVLLRAPGYPEKALLLRRDFNPVAALNLVSIVCWAIDLATGAMFRIDPDTLLVSMNPAAAPAPGQVGLPPPFYPTGSAVPQAYDVPPSPQVSPPTPAAPAPVPSSTTPAPPNAAPPVAAPAPSP
jgi:hypothetical protein